MFFCIFRGKRIVHDFLQNLQLKLIDQFPPLSTLEKNVCKIWTCKFAFLFSIRISFVYSQYSKWFNRDDFVRFQKFLRFIVVIVVWSKRATVLTNFDVKNLVDFLYTDTILGNIIPHLYWGYCNCSVWFFIYHLLFTYRERTCRFHCTICWVAYWSHCKT